MIYEIIRLRWRLFVVVDCLFYKEAFCLHVVWITKTSVCFLVALMLLLPFLCSVIKDKCKSLVDFITNCALRCVIMLHLEVKEDYIDGSCFSDGVQTETKIRRESSRWWNEIRAPVFMQPYLFGESCHFKVSLFTKRNVNLEQHQPINRLSNI